MIELDRRSPYHFAISGKSFQIVRDQHPELLRRVSDTLLLFIDSVRLAVCPWHCLRSDVTGTEATTDRNTARAGVGLGVSVESTPIDVNGRVTAPEGYRGDGVLGVRTAPVGGFVHGEASEKRIRRSTAENVREGPSEDVAEDRVDERIGHRRAVAEPGDREPDVRRDASPALVAHRREKCTDEERRPESDEDAEDDHQHSQSFAFVRRHQVGVAEARGVLLLLLLEEARQDRRGVRGVRVRRRGESLVTTESEGTRMGQEIR